jgi:hypothetical protein
MLLHRVEGIKIETSVFADDGFAAHAVTFFSEGRAFAFVTFYTDVDEVLTVNGGNVWGVVGNGSPNVNYDVHVRREELRMMVFQGETSKNWLHAFYVGTDSKLTVSSETRLEFAITKVAALATA